MPDSATSAEKFCIGISKSWKIPPEEILQILAETGWDGFFPCLEPGLDVPALARHASSLGLFIQSFHAPWTKSADMWGDDEAKAKAGVDELISCVHTAVDAGAPFLVIHAWIGFTPTEATAKGIERYGKVIEEARRSGIKIAVENTEGENHLDALMEAFRGDSTVGFCWDTGHELCYNRARDLMADFGDRLLGTHINDNLGVSDPTGPTTWIDDLHLLPFDGIADWPGIASRIARSGFSGPLTFELNRASKPGRHENDVYAAMSVRDWLAAARERADRVAALLRTARAGV